MKKAKTLFLNTMVLTATSILVNIVSMSFSVYISNKIGAEAMGIYQLVISVFVFATTLAVSGIGLATTRLVAEELAKGFEAGAKKAVRRCLIYAFSFGLLAAILLTVNAKNIAVYWIHNKITIRPLYILAISLPFISMSSVISGYFNAVRRVVKSASAQVFERFARILVTVYVLNLLLPKGLEMAYIAIFLGGTLSEIGSFLCIFVLYLFDKRRYKVKTDYGKDLTKRMFRISIPIALSSCIRSALYTVKQVITPLSLERSGVSCNIALANYGIINGMVLPLIIFPNCLFSALSSLLVPEITRFHVTKNYTKINYIIAHVFKITLLISLCICGVFFNFSGALGIILYNSAEVSHYIKVFSFLTPVMYFDSIIDAFLKGLNQQLSVVRINIIDTITTIVFTFTLLPVYGIDGYIAVIFISEILNTLLSFRKLLKVTSFHVKFFDWVLKPTFAIIIVSIILQMFFSLNLIIGIIFTVVIYLAILYILGSVTKEDFKLLN